MSLLKPIETFKQTSSATASTAIGSFDANVAGNNKAALFFVGYQRRGDANRAVTSLKLGTQAPTLIQRHQTSSVSVVASIIEIWYLPSPTATIESLSIAISGTEEENAIGVHVALLDEVNVSALIGAVVTSTSADQIKSIAFTPQVAGSSVFGFCSSLTAARSPWTPGTGVTERLDTVVYDADSSSGRPVFIGEKPLATADATTFDFSNDSYSDDAATIIFEVKSGVTPGLPSDILKFEGVAQANLTGLQVFMTKGTAFWGTVIHDNTTGTTDANGRYAAITPTSGAVGDPVLLYFLTADGKGVVVKKTLEDIN